MFILLKLTYLDILLLVALRFSPSKDLDCVNDDFSLHCAQEMSFWDWIKANQYEDCALDTPQLKDIQAAITRREQPQRPTVDISYVCGMSDEMRLIYNNHGISIYTKPIKTLRQQLVKPKDRTPSERQFNVCRIPDYLVYDKNPAQQYIDEPKRTVGIQGSENIKSLIIIYDSRWPYQIHRSHRQHEDHSGRRTVIGMLAR